MRLMNRLLSSWCRVVRLRCRPCVESVYLLIAFHQDCDTAARVLTVSSPASSAVVL